MNTENDQSKDAQSEEHISRREFDRYKRDVWLFLVGVLGVSSIPGGGVYGIPVVIALVGLFVWAWRGYK